MRNFVVIAGLLLAVSGCGSGTTEVAPPSSLPMAARVTMSASRFSPDTARIAVGGTVTFVNGTGVLHDVDFGTPAFRINAFDSGERSLSFPTAGTLSYHCNLHAGMEATLVVR